MDHQVSVWKAHDSAELEMSNVFKALRAGKDSDVLASLKNFKEALEPLNQNSSRRDSNAGDMYNDRLQTRLHEMSLKNLKPLGEAAAKFQGRSVDQDPVVARLDVAIQAELAKRDALMAAADPHMSSLLDGLVSGNTTAVRACGNRFNAALTSVNNVQADYTDRLRANLDKLPQKDLEAVGPAARDFLEQADNPLVQYLDSAVKDVLSARMSATFKKADEELEKVLDALASGDASKIQRGVQAFTGAADPKAGSTRGDMSSFDAYNDRLQWRLGTMSMDHLIGLLQTRASATERDNDPVVARLDIAALAEYLLRLTQDVSSKGYQVGLSDFSREELRDLAGLVSTVVESVQRYAPNVKLADGIPGTSFNQKRLDDLRDGVDEQLAIRIVLEDHARPIAGMTVNERNDAAAAVQFCNERNLSPLVPMNQTPEVVNAHKSLWNTQLKRLADNLAAAG